MEEMKCWEVKASNLQQGITAFVVYSHGKGHLLSMLRRSYVEVSLGLNKETVAIEPLPLRLHPWGRGQRE